MSTLQKIRLFGPKKQWWSVGFMFEDDKVEALAIHINDDNLQVAEALEKMAARIRLIDEDSLLAIHDHEVDNIKTLRHKWSPK